LLREDTQKEIERLERLEDVSMKMKSLGLVFLFLAATVAHAMEVPQGAQRHMARGMAAMQLAKNPADFRDAVSEFRQATTLAPDWPDAWFNLGIAQESAGDYAGAIRSFRTYLAKSPQAADRNEVQTRIFGLEYKQERVAAQQATERREQAAKQQLVQALQQGRWRGVDGGPRRVIENLTVSGEGKVMIRVAWGPDVPRVAGGMRVIWPKPGMLSAIYEGSLSDRNMTGRFREWSGEEQRQQTGTFQGRISADATRMELTVRYDAHPELAPQQVVFVRQ
jgi:tetratricopeptide (TPR) repeat protein